MCVRGLRTLAYFRSQGTTKRLKSLQLFNDSTTEHMCVCVKSTWSLNIVHPWRLRGPSSFPAAHASIWWTHVFLWPLLDQLQHPDFPFYSLCLSLSHNSFKLIKRFQAPSAEDLSLETRGFFSALWFFVRIFSAGNKIRNNQCFLCWVHFPIMAAAPARTLPITALRRDDIINITKCSQISCASE